MDILQARESIKDVLELLAESLLCILDFSGVEPWGENFQSVIVFIDNRDSFRPSDWDIPLIRLILKPARICVGSCLWVRLRTISRNSWCVGTGAIYQAVKKHLAISSAKLGAKDRWKIDLHPSTSSSWWAQVRSQISNDPWSNAVSEWVLIEWVFLHEKIVGRPFFSAGRRANAGTKIGRIVI